MQRRCKQAFLTIERLCFLRGACKVIIKKSSVEKSQLSFKKQACQDMGTEELELSRVLELAFAAVNWKFPRVQ
jgi:hypothetical protein